MNLLRMLIAAVACATGTPQAGAAAVADTLTRPAIAVAKPSKAVLLAITRAGRRLVAVGERGLIVVSDDDGRQWRQTRVPVSVTLTAAAFPHPKLGWAVGHRGAVLRSTDAGDTWALALDGRQFAALALARALAAQGGLGEGRSKRATADAQALVKDGADKPFLDLSFADERHGLAVGAYGLCARTDDAGATWQSCIDRLDNPNAAHLYAIARVAQTTFIVGEQGLLLRSDDGGIHFVSVPMNYAGGLFCVGATASGEIVVGGLRGHAFVSTDRGRSFVPVASDSQGSFSGTVRTADGTLLMVNQLGQVLRYIAAERRMALLPTPPRAPLSAAVLSDAQALVAVGVHGVASLGTADKLIVERVKP